MCKAHFSQQENATTMRIGIARRSSRNTLHLFRLPYVKYSTGANLTPRTVYRALRKPDSTVARQGVRTTDGVTEIRTTERIVFPRVSAIERILRLFFAYFFLARQKKVCRRRHSCGVTAKMESPVNPGKSPRILRMRSLRVLRARLVPSGHKNGVTSFGVTKPRALRALIPVISFLNSPNGEKD